MKTQKNFVYLKNQTMVSNEFRKTFFQESRQQLKEFSECEHWNVFIIYTENKKHMPTDKLW